MRAISLVIAVGLFVCAQTASGEKKHDPRNPTKFIEAFPSTVYHLFQWPDAKVIEGENRLLSNDPDIVNAKQMCWTRLKRVLDSDWLPADDSDAIYLRNEFRNRDTVRLRWLHDGYRIEACQTASAFTLKLTPVEKKSTGEDLKERTQYAQELSKQVFTDETYMWPVKAPITDPRIAVKSLKQRIASFSFDPAKAKELSADKLVVGYEKSIDGIGINPAHDYVEDATSEDPVAGTKQAAFYWFRNIRWWNDGESVGYYFLKIDGPGMWVASYVGEIDVNWFRPRKIPKPFP